MIPLNRLGHFNEVSSDTESKKAENIGNSIKHSPVFNSIENRRMSETSYKEMYHEILDRSESEFYFSPELTKDADRLTKDFQSEKWEKFSIEEKEQCIKDFANALGEKLGLQNVPDVKFYEAPLNDCGGFDDRRNVIALNINYFDSPRDIVDTVAHETRHAYQHQRAIAPKTYLDKLYAFNFSHYITPIVDSNGKCLFFQDYQDQLVEAEARAFAKCFSNREGLQ